MSAVDLILRGGTLVRPEGETIADLALEHGQITALGPNIPGPAREEIDVTGLHIFPGLIDPHVHFNEPGRADWEGFQTGSRALAAGGGTLFFDMPLNAHPPTLDAESFHLKLTAALRTSLTDFAFWGGLVPQNLAHLEALAACGVIGFKAFMADSGIEDFPRADDATLRTGMTLAAKLNLPVAVHAESESLTRDLAQTSVDQGKTSIRDFLNSRPVQAELEAIRRALDLAGETGCALHVVHVSSGQGLALIAEAKARGANVSCETCPHYLVLTEADLEQLGPVAKCAPPLRGEPEQTALWQHLLAGRITFIGSDHSPAPPDMKRDPNFFKVWGGISGVQHTLPLLLTGSRLCTPAHSPATRSLLARLTSLNIAERFRLPPGKGRLELGADADLALVALEEKFTVGKDDLFYRHQQSPYLGRALTGRVVRTFRRGETIFNHGKITAANGGKLVKPA